MKKALGVFLFLFLWQNQVLAQGAGPRLKREEIEVGLKLHQTPAILKEEKETFFKITPFKTISLVAPSYRISSYRVSCNCRYCALSLRDGKILAYDLEKGDIVLDKKFSTTSIYSLHIHPFKNLICFGDQQGRIIIFDLDKKTELHTFYEADKAVSDVKFSPDGKLIATAYLESGNINLFEIENYEKLKTITAHKKGIYCLAFSPNQDLLVYGLRDKKIGVTNREGKWPSQILSNHKSVVLSLDFSEDNRFLASTGADSQLLVWGVKDGSIEETPVFSWIHSDWVNTVKFFKDYLITGSKDGGVRIFDYKNKKILGNFKYHQPIFSIDITPDGEYLFAASSDILIYKLKDILEKIESKE